MNLRDGKGKVAGVVGMGRSGHAAARMLAYRNFSVVGFDDSKDAKSSKYITKTIFGSFSRNDLESLSILVLSPGVPISSRISLLAEEMSIPVVGEVELAFCNTSAEMLAITGSNGKTTTVEWLAHVLRESGSEKQAVATGNNGYSLCDALLDYPECSVFPVELSSYQLETIFSFRPLVAAILNLTPDHLARHGSMKNYSEAKARIFMNQKKSDALVLNYDSFPLEEYRNASCGNQYYFSLKTEVPMGAWMDSSGMIYFRDTSGKYEVIHSDKIVLPGAHNIANALAVVCMAAVYGVPIPAIASGLTDFYGVPHRIEALGEVRGIKWFNDSKSTNIDSLKVALQSFDQRVILIAGGKEKESDYSVLNPLIQEKVKSIILFGSGAESLKKQWKSTTEIVVVKALEEAVTAALSVALEKDIVLLSPGCASFDQYKNFEKRGEHFKMLVQALI